jgi:hypothetical protein
MYMYIFISKKCSIYLCIKLVLKDATKLVDRIIVGLVVDICAIADVQLYLIYQGVGA